MDFIALTIAGSDPGGGAGLQADLKTFHQFGVFGTSVATLITVQNTVRVSRVDVLASDLVAAQIDALLEDLPPRAVKTGALGSAANIEAIAARTFGCPLVVDPVMISTHGTPLLDRNAREILRHLLLPRATLITPNLDEAADLAGIAVADPAAMREAAQRIAQLGVASVLVKGGHLADGDALDILLHEGVLTEFRASRLHTKHTHGTGCTYSAAITACLAQGLDVPAAIAAAKRFLHEAIRTAPGLGSGSGPLNFFAPPGQL